MTFVKHSVAPETLLMEFCQVCKHLKSKCRCKTESTDEKPESDKEQKIDVHQKSNDN